MPDRTLMVSAGWTTMDKVSICVVLAHIQRWEKDLSHFVYVGLFILWSPINLSLKISNRSSMFLRLTKIIFCNVLLCRYEVTHTLNVLIRYWCNLTGATIMCLLNFLKLSAENCAILRRSAMPARHMFRPGLHQSVCHKPVLYQTGQKKGSRKQRHTISHGLLVFCWHRCRRNSDG